MKKYFLYPLMALLAGCSTGPYLYPESATGKNAMLDRTCPGPKAAMSFAPPLGRTQLGACTGLCSAAGHIELAG